MDWQQGLQFLPLDSGRISELLRKEPQEFSEVAFIICEVAELLLQMKLTKISIHKTDICTALIKGGSRDSKRGHWGFLPVLCAYSKCVLQKFGFYENYWLDNHSELGKPGKQN